LINAIKYSFLIFWLTSCTKDIEILNLSDHVESSGSKISKQYLIACAAGNKTDVNLLTSVFYYPIEGTHDVKYFESREENPVDFSSYYERKLPESDFFNGYLKRFKIDNNEAKWVILTYLVEDSLRISDPIRLKTNFRPTEQSCTVEIDETSFEWEDGIYDDNIIYFQVVTDSENNLISGTYTKERNFTFKDYSNVVLDIRDENMVPDLIKGAAYNFTLMGISDDNWVNLFCETSFSI